MDNTGCRFSTVCRLRESFHSRQSLSKEQMGGENVKAFDTELTHVLSGFADGEGVIGFNVSTRVTWGKPLA